MGGWVGWGGSSLKKSLTQGNSILKSTLSYTSFYRNAFIRSPWIPLSNGTAVDIKYLFQQAFHLRKLKNILQCMICLGASARVIYI